ncbi:hypothetical protein [Longimicrobium sp.]|uniref:hypothetical protein n=1 Tax=Longimicrobium sp. TaxID=2029185 RepID=UPI003B3B9857
MLPRHPASLALLALLAAAASPARAQSTFCMALEGRLPTPDSLIVTASPGPCTPLRLEVTGPARRREGDPFWSLGGTHQWTVPVALVNTGSEPLELPLRMDVDSMIPIQRGMPVWRANPEGLVHIWIQEDAELPSAFWFRGQEGRTVLRPGERVSRSVTLATHVLTHAFRIPVFRIPDPNRARILNDNFMDDPEGPPLPADVARFVEAAGFPAGSRPRLLVHDEANEIAVFRVDFLEVDCTPPSCGTQHAVGVRHSSRIGWVGERIGWYGSLPAQLEALDAHVRATRFVPTVEQDPQLFSAELLARMTVQPWPVRVPRSPDYDLRPLLMNAPGAPLPFLRDLARQTYTGDDDELAQGFLNLPDLQDPELLALLLDSPGTLGRFQILRDTVPPRLRAVAPRVAEDPSAHAAVLFAVARVLRADDGALAARIAAHPNAASNPATLTVLSGVDPKLAPRVLSAAAAPPAQQRRLAAALGTGGEGMVARIRAARELVDDPAATEAVLTVLANLPAQEMRDVAWRASRRLPETAYRRWEPAFRPRL